MEDPEREVVEVIRGLVDRPTLEGQAQCLRRYFTPDCKFYHIYINVTSGVKDLTGIYQIAELTFNYRGVDIHQVFYNEAENAVAVRCVVYLRPLTNFFRLVEFHVFVLLELEDYLTQDGKVVKKIRVQRDFFERAPLPLLFPIIGDIYASQTLRVMLGLFEVRIFMLVRLILTVMRLILTVFLPKSVTDSIMLE